jgi:hypothetical protein
MDLVTLGAAADPVNASVCIPREIWLSQYNVIISSAEMAELVFFGVGLVVGIVLTYLYLKGRERILEEE